MDFNKEAISTHAMVEKLLARGMKVNDISEAEHVLNHVNYYRLSPYWRIFEVDRPNGDHSFQSGQVLIKSYGFMNLTSRFECCSWRRSIA